MTPELTIRRALDAMVTANGNKPVPAVGATWDDADIRGAPFAIARARAGVCAALVETARAEGWLQ